MLVKCCHLSMRRRKHALRRCCMDVAWLPGTTTPRYQELPHVSSTGMGAEARRELHSGGGGHAGPQRRHARQRARLPARGAARRVAGRGQGAPSPGVGPCAWTPGSLSQYMHAQGHLLASQSDDGGLTLVRRPATPTERRPAEARRGAEGGVRPRRAWTSLAASRCGARPRRRRRSGRRGTRTRASLRSLTCGWTAPTRWTRWRACWRVGRQDRWHLTESALLWLHVEPAVVQTLGHALSPIHTRQL